MKEITVNGAIELVNTLRQRLSSLQGMRNQSLVVERTIWMKDDRREEKDPLYNPVDVDRKMVLIQNAIRKLNSAIKESNAKTKISTEVDDEVLLAPVEAAKKESK